MKLIVASDEKTPLTDEVVAQIPPHAEPVGSQTQELAFGANALEEHHEVQLEEDDRIDRGTTTLA